MIAIAIDKVGKLPRGAKITLLMRHKNTIPRINADTILLLSII